MAAGPQPEGQVPRLRWSDGRRRKPSGHRERASPLAPPGAPQRGGGVAGGLDQCWPPGAETAAPVTGIAMAVATTPSGYYTNLKEKMGVAPVRGGMWR